MYLVTSFPIIVYLVPFVMREEKTVLHLRWVTKLTFGKKWGISDVIIFSLLFLWGPPWPRFWTFMLNGLLWILKAILQASLRFLTEIMLHFLIFSNTEVDVESTHNIWVVNEPILLYCHQFFNLVANISDCIWSSLLDLFESPIKWIRSNA